MPNERFPKSLRLLRAREFERVFAARSSAGNRWITVHGAASDLAHARLGLVVSRRVGSAALRNRWKRMLREAFRLAQRELPPLDLICIPRTQAPPALRELMASMTVLAAQLTRRTERQVRQRTGSGE